MIVVRLYGSLASQFGTRFDLHVHSAQEALHALLLQIKGLKQALRDGFYQVRFKREDLDEDTLRDALSQESSDGVLHIVPRVAGAGSGVGKIIAGAVLVVVGIVLNVYTGVSGTGFIQMGAAMIMGGVAQMLSKQPSRNKDDTKTNASHAFGTTANLVGQGSPVPLVYGITYCGSRLVSQSVDSFYIKQIKPKPPQPQETDFPLSKYPLPTDPATLAVMRGSGGGGSVLSFNLNRQREAAKIREFEARGLNYREYKKAMDAWNAIPQPIETPNQGLTGEPKTAPTPTQGLRWLFPTRWDFAVFGVYHVVKGGWAKSLIESPNDSSYGGDLEYTEQLAKWYEHNADWQETHLPPNVRKHLANVDLGLLVRSSYLASLSYLQNPRDDRHIQVYRPDRDLPHIRPRLYDALPLSRDAQIQLLANVVLDLHERQFLAWQGNTQNIRQTIGDWLNRDYPPQEHELLQGDMFMDIQRTAHDVQDAYKGERRYDTRYEHDKENVSVKAVNYAARFGGV